MKSQLCVNKKTASCMVYGELGRFKIEVNVQKRMIGFWLKIVKSKLSKLSNVFYRLLRNMYEANEYKSSWIHKIKTILDSCGMSNVWEHPNDFNHSWILNSVELKLKDMERQNLHAEVERNVLCRNYKIFKTDFGREIYITELDTSDRIALSKYRCGSHKLPVAIERYARQENHHPCRMCDTNELGDEYHYLLVCPTIREIRERYLPSYFCRTPSIIKFSQLLSVTNNKKLKNLAKFVNQILSLF